MDFNTIFMCTFRSAYSCVSQNRETNKDSYITFFVLTLIITMTEGLMNIKVIMCWWACIHTLYK